MHECLRLRGPRLKVGTLSSFDHVLFEAMCYASFTYLLSHLFTAPGLLVPFV